MATLRSKAPVVLFGYDSSAFTQKVRLALRLKQIPYTFVLVPSMMPRPILRDNFNITYRKIPVVMLGREAYIDTSLICEALERRFPPNTQHNYGTLYPPVSNGGPQRSLIRALASYWTDRPLFRQTCGLMPSSVWRSSFGADRAGLIGHKLDPDKLQRKIPQMMSGLDMHLSLLEALFEESTPTTTAANNNNNNDKNNNNNGKRKWIMDTPHPGLADVAFFYQLDWAREIALGHGVEDLTGGEVHDGGEPGAEQLFARYPLLQAWYRRMKQYSAGLATNETRVDRDDHDGVAAVVQSILGSELEKNVPLLPTPAPPYTELDERNGLMAGARITIAPVDTGMNDPSVGTLLAATPEEIVIAPEDLEGRHADIRLHFPRTEFRARPIGDSRL